MRMSGCVSFGLIRDTIDGLPEFASSIRVRLGSIYTRLGSVAPIRSHPVEHITNTHEAIRPDLRNDQYDTQLVGAATESSECASTQSNAIIPSTVRHTQIVV